MTDTPDRDALLAEAAWAHRLARALLRDPDLAADAAQDALVAAIEQQPTWNGRAQLRGWLRTVLRRIAAATRRRESERLRKEVRAARPEGHDAERRAQEHLSLHRDLTAAVQALPEPYRTAVTLRFLGNQPPRAIARQCGTTSAVVRQRVHRGLELLRQRLDREHGGRAGWAAPLATLLPAFPYTTLTPLTIMAKKSLAAVAVLAAAASTWLALREPSPTVGADLRADAPLAGADLATGSDGATPDAAAAATASAAPTRRSAEFAVTVVDTADRPLADAVVFAWSEGTAPSRRAPRTDGCARFPASAAAGFVLAAAPRHAPRVLAVPHQEGGLRVSLAPGRRVAGQLLADGAPAGAGIRLRLTPTHTADANLPPAIAEFLGEACDATTAADGAFCFDGLADAWQGTLQLPTTHWFVPAPGLALDGERRLFLPQPEEGLVLATTALPAIRGRVVFADDDEPVPMARILGTAEFTDSMWSPSIAVDADASGRFAIGFWPAPTNMRERWLDPRNRPPLAAVGITAQASGSGASQTRFDAAAIAAPDGVVVRVPRLREQHFAAVDANGNPVPAARVLGAELSAPAAADGSGTFAGSARFVGAPGHAVVPAVPRSGDGSAAQPFLFELPAAHALVLHLHHPDGSPAQPRLVVLTAEQPLFDGFPTGTELHVALSRGLAGSSFERDGGPVALNLDADAHGDIEIASPRPDLDCTLTVRDPLGFVVLEQALRTPAIGHRETVAIELPTAARIVHGRVLGPDGGPLREAIVRLRPLDRERFADSRITDDNGTFEFAPTQHRGPLAVRVEHSGCAAAERVLGAETDSFELRLTAGRRIVASVVDAAGEGIAVQSPLLRRAGSDAPLDLRLQWLEPGRFAFADAPALDLVFRCDLGGRTFELPVPDLATEMTLSLPTPAHVTFGPPPRGYALPATDSIGVACQGLDPAGRMFVIRPDAETDPIAVPPGRYRFVLVRNTWNAETRRTETTELTAAVERTLRAGESATIALQ